MTPRVTRSAVVFGAVPDLRVEVEVLIVVAVERPDDLRFRAIAAEGRRDLGLRQLGTEVALDPVDRRVGVGDAALDCEVVGLLREVLKAAVLDVAVLARGDFDDAAVVLLLGRFAGGLALENRNRGRFLGDDERVVEQRAGVLLRSDGDIFGRRRLLERRRPSRC